MGHYQMYFIIFSIGEQSSMFIYEGSKINLLNKVIFVRSVAEKVGCVTSACTAAYLEPSNYAYSQLNSLHNVDIRHTTPVPREFF